VILNIRVIPRASKSLIKQENNQLKVYLTQPAYEGLANKQLISLICGYLKVRKHQVKIIKGERSRNKLIKISDEDAG
jgi:uncharacterized protein (TIGR00251 family)